MQRNTSSIAQGADTLRDCVQNRRGCVRASALCLDRPSGRMAAERSPPSGLLPVRGSQPSMAHARLSFPEEREFCHDPPAAPPVAGAKIERIVFSAHGHVDGIAKAGQSRPLKPVKSVAEGPGMRVISFRYLAQEFRADICLESGFIALQALQIVAREPRTLADFGNVRFPAGLGDKKARLSIIRLREAGPVETLGHEAEILVFWKVHVRAEQAGAFCLDRFRDARKIFFAAQALNLVLVEQNAFVHVVTSHDSILLQGSDGRLLAHRNKMDSVRCGKNKSPENTYKILIWKDYISNRGHAHATPGAVEDLLTDESRAIMLRPEVGAPVPGLGTQSDELRAALLCRSSFSNQENGESD